jgi:hypothetical protein
MYMRHMGLIVLLTMGVLGNALGSRGEDPKSKKLTADEVVKLWAPQLKSASHYGQTGGSPEHSNVAAYTFTVVGPTFEELWNHYAQLCGTSHQYEEKTFLITSETGAKGSFVISDGSDGKGGRGLSIFLLKTDAYTVTVTFHTNPDDESIRGSLSAVVP